MLELHLSRGRFMLIVFVWPKWHLCSSSIGYIPAYVCAFTVKERFHYNNLYFIFQRNHKSETFNLPVAKSEYISVWMQR